MTLPELKDWSQTRDSLHHAARVLGATRKLLVERQPNFQHLSLGVVPNGLSTGATPAGEMILDFIEQAVVYQASSGKVYKMMLRGLSQALLRDTLAEAMAESGQLTMPDRELFSGSQSPFEIRASQAKDYANVLYTIYSGLRNFWQKLPEPKTPPVVWPHHFDLSFLWFAGETADEHSTPHMNFGFSPYTEGIDEPYLYSYAWSPAAGYIDIALPPDTERTSSGSKHTILKYSVLRQQPDPIAFIEQYFQGIWENTKPLLK